NAPVWAIAIQPDGRVVVGGEFTQVGGQLRTRVARLHPNGGLDASFINPDVNNTVGALLVMPSGKIMVGGSFTAVNGQARGRLVRLEANGELDTSLGDLGANNS